MATPEEIQEAAREVKLALEMFSIAIDRLLDSVQPSETTLAGFASAEEARQHRMAREFGAQLEKELG